MGNGIGNGRLRWAWLFEWVIVPMLGIVILALALAGLTIPTWIIPLVPGLVLFPFARQVDKLRRNERGK